MSEKARIPVSGTLWPSPLITSATRLRLASGVSSSPISTSTFFFRLSTSPSENNCFILDFRWLYIGKAFFRGVEVREIPTSEGPAVLTSTIRISFFLRRRWDVAAIGVYCSPRICDIAPSLTSAICSRPLLLKFSSFSSMYALTADSFASLPPDNRHSTSAVVKFAKGAEEHTFLLSAN